MEGIPTSISRARRLRRNMTEAETLLWANLRNRRQLNLKFLRQHALIYQVSQNQPYYFISDFYCAEKKFVIEVDGEIHNFQKEEDQHREEIIRELGLRVLRIKNEEVKDVHQVLEKIRQFALNL